MKKSAQSFLDLLGGGGCLLPRSGGVDEKEAKIVNFLQKVTSASVFLYATSPLVPSLLFTPLPHCRGRVLFCRYRDVGRMDETKKQSWLKLPLQSRLLFLASSYTTYHITLLLLMLLLYIHSFWLICFLSVARGSRLPSTSLCPRDFSDRQTPPLSFCAALYFARRHQASLGKQAMILAGRQGAGKTATFRVAVVRV